MKRFFFTSVILSLLTSILLSFNAQAQNEFVDLGLSVTWATCNVGANSPEENGEYYTFDNALTLKKNEERLPTREEFQELIDNCTWLWAEEKGVKGYKVTSKKNSNSIFLPAAGKRDKGIDGPKAIMESTTTVEGSTIRDTLEELERADDEATLDELRLSEDDETTLDELRLVEDEDCSFFLLDDDVFLPELDFAKLLLDDFFVFAEDED